MITYESSTNEYRIERARLENRKVIFTLEVRIQNTQRWKNCFPEREFISELEVRGALDTLIAFDNRKKTYI